MSGCIFTSPNIAAHSVSHMAPYLRGMVLGWRIHLLIPGLWVGSSRKQESSRKTSTSLLITPKPLTAWITTNCGKFWKRWEYQTTWPAFWEICQEAAVRTWHGTIDWFQIGKGVRQGCIFSPTYLNYMHASTLCKMPSWMKHKLESRLPREISTLQISRWHHPYGRKWRRA